MEKLIITICASKDSFGAFSENCDGIFAAGDTLEQCKKDVDTSIEQIKRTQPYESWPEIIKGPYEIEWRYDVESLLIHFNKFFTLAGLERITGIHQKQLWSYMHGQTKPRAAQKERIRNSLFSFAKELSSFSLL